jgi:hypothetical protein
MVTRIQVLHPEKLGPVKKKELVINNRELWRHFKCKHKHLLFIQNMAAFLVSITIYCHVYE